MTKELTAEVVSDMAEPTHLSTKPSEEQTYTGELPFYIIPDPPIPGKTAWSIAPW